jgi:hypothetical protein
VIVEALLQLIVDLFTGLLSFLVTALPAAPTWWLDAMSAVNVVLGGVGEPVRHFLPLAPLVAVGVTLTGLRLTLGGLKLARRVVSLMTGGGGGIG